MVLEDVDLEIFTKILNDPSTQKFKEKHTVIDPVTVSIQVTPK
jgi:hypothetical protein